MPESCGQTYPKAPRIHSITDFKAVTFAPPEEDQASRLFKEAMVYPAFLIAEKGLPLGESYSFRSARFYPKTAPLHPADAIEALRAAYEKIPTSPLLRGVPSRSGAGRFCAPERESTPTFSPKAATC